jgi:hypothetical protein
MYSDHVLLHSREVDAIIIQEGNTKTHGIPPFRHPLHIPFLRSCVENVKP